MTRGLTVPRRARGSQAGPRRSRVPWAQVRAPARPSQMATPRRSRPPSRSMTAPSDAGGQFGDIAAGSLGGQGQGDHQVVVGAARAQLEPGDGKLAGEHVGDHLVHVGVGARGRRRARRGPARPAWRPRPRAGPARRHRRRRRRSRRQRPARPGRRATGNGRASGCQARIESMQVNAGMARRPSSPISVGIAISLAFSPAGPARPGRCAASWSPRPAPGCSICSARTATTGTSSRLAASAVSTACSLPAPAANASSAAVTPASAPPSSSRNAGSGPLIPSTAPTVVAGRRTCGSAHQDTPGRTAVLRQCGIFNLVGPTQTDQALVI